jgi:hypothetical protein
MVRCGVADIGKKANSEQRGAKEGRRKAKSLPKRIKKGKKCHQIVTMGTEIGASKKRFLV